MDSGTIENCHLTGTISNISLAGGIAGRNPAQPSRAVILSRCTRSGKWRGQQGGVLGKLEGTTATISGPPSRAVDYDFTILAHTNYASTTKAFTISVTGRGIFVS